MTPPGLPPAVGPLKISETALSVAPGTLNLGKVKLLVPAPPELFIGALVLKVEKGTAGVVYIAAWAELAPNPTKSKVAEA